MHRWIAKAAGGTSHRLKPGLAIVRSRSVYCRPDVLRASAAVPRGEERVQRSWEVLFWLAWRQTRGFALGMAAFALFGIVAVVFLRALAWLAKAAWWRRLRTIQPLSSPETATGLAAIGRVRLLERPHSNDNYLTREMGYLSFDKLHEYGACIADDPETCVAKLKDMKRRFGVTEFVFWFNIGGIDKAHVERAMKLAAEQVIPNV